MTAIAIDGAGGPEVLAPCTLPVPQPGTGQVLIRVAHAGVNRPDVVQRQGLYPPPPGAPDTPGLEVAGEVVALGAGVSPAIMARPQCALVAGGGYAQFCLAEAAHCLPVPDELPLAEAAAMPETLLTVWHNLFERGMASEGDWALVHGGTSGIGTMAIKLANLFGVKIVVTCGSEEKCAAALALGADHAIDYRQVDFVAEVKAITQGRGVDVALDMVSGDYVARNLACMAQNGRHVTIAVMGGIKADGVPMATIMRNRLTLTGSTLRARSNEFKADLVAEVLREVWPFVASGQLRPLMDRSFPLAEAADAHRLMESGNHRGKIVLDV